MHQDAFLCAKVLIFHGLLSKQYIARIICQRSTSNISYLFDIKDIVVAGPRKTLLSEQYVRKRTSCSQPKIVNQPLSIVSAYLFRASIQPLNRLNPSAVSSCCSLDRWLSTATTMSDARFECGYAKVGTATCKKCKQKIEKGALRIAKVVANPYSSAGGDMKQYHHPNCMFETFVRARATTRVITEPDDVHGYEDLVEEDQKIVDGLIEDLMEKRNKTGKKTPSKKAADSNDSSTPKKAQNVKSDKSESTKPAKAAPAVKPTKPVAATVSSGIDDVEWGDDDLDDEEFYKIDVDVSIASSSKDTPSASVKGDKAQNSAVKEAAEKDNSFREYRKLCAEIAEESSYNGKTAILSQFLQKGSTGAGYQGDTFLLLKLLLPSVIKAVYNLKDKQIVKLFSQIFDTDLDEMIEDLEQGDVAETIALFFEKSKKCPPQKKGTLSLQEVDDLLDELCQYTKEDEQTQCLTKIAKRCTANDLKMIIRLIKHDLRINAGPRHILDALGPNAYEAFMASRNLKDIVDRVFKAKNAPQSSSKGELVKTVSVRAQLMTPVQPMLAEACRSVDQAMKRCPNGMYAEIKYDGERVQLHKQGKTFQYFSRSLKPVQAHKVQHLKDFIPRAFPGGANMILDCEILLVDNKTSKPLPFGTLGVHKRAAFKDATVCLFVFDCMHYNEESLMNNVSASRQVDVWIRTVIQIKPIKDRKKILMENMKEIKNHIMFSEIRPIKPQDRNSLTDLMTTVFSEGLEGLVLKDINSVYEPGKRHWLKIKKDYLADGAMADSADLVVLGAYFGTGGKGGIMSVFLMGCYDPNTFRWCTVTKCGNGFDDKMLKKLQTQFKVVKINKDPVKVPPWLNVTKTLIPDFVVEDPKKSQVWEITGAEFSKSEVHTAGGVSIRFPRFSRLRDDKSVQQATDLPQLLKLFASSKDKSDIPELLKTKGGIKKKRDPDDDDDDDDQTEEEEISDDDEPRPPVASTSKSKAEENDVELGKRKAVEAEELPAKKERKDEVSNGLPVCRYGADCYQKNSEHRQKFSHPTSTPVSAANEKVSAASNNQILPNVFDGCKFFISDTVTDREKMKRFIIAFNGDVMTDYEKATATHIVVSSVSKAAEDTSGRSVPADWVWQCIKTKTLIKRS